MKRNTENLKKDLFKIFGNKYILDEVEYNGFKNKVTLICQKHGEFKATPHNLLKGKGCPYCAGKHKTTERFVEEAKKIHGDKYIYTKTEYKKATEKVIITCPIHGDFEQTPNKHLNNDGCPLCAGKFKNTEEYVEELKRKYGDKYDYSKVKYVNSKTPILLYCKEKDIFGEEHGWFKITPDKLKMGVKCKKCSGMLIQTTEDFIKYSKLIHGDYYIYDKTDLNNRDEKGRLCITCPKHGDFWQLPHGHLSGKGCSICNESHLERDIRILLEEKNIKYIFFDIFFQGLRKFSSIAIFHDNIKIFFSFFRIFEFYNIWMVQILKNCNFIF